MDRVGFGHLSIQVTRPGFEPRPSEPESEILPLYYRAIGSANVGELFFLWKSPAQIIACNRCNILLMLLDRRGLKKI